MRKWWPLVLVVAGLAAGAVWLALEPTSTRAETTVVIARNGSPLPSVSGTVAQLVTSDTVLENVAQSLGLGHAAALRPHVAVRTQSGALHISYDSANAVQAVKILQQIAVQLGVATSDRFGLQATVFDPAHAAGKTARHPLRDLGLGLAAGVLAALSAWLLLRRRAADDDRYRVSALRKAAERGAKAHPERVDDWQAYLAVLASQADGDFVPHALDGVVQDVFAPVLPPK